MGRLRLCKVVHIYSSLHALPAHSYNLCLGSLFGYYYSHDMNDIFDHTYGMEYGPDNLNAWNENLPGPSGQNASGNFMPGSSGGNYYSGHF